jgi:hypothetical protein
MCAAARIAINLLVAVVIVGLTASARAGDANPAPAPAPASTPTPLPTATAVAAAGAILGEIGIKEKIALVVPTMMTELEQNLTKTHPEIKDSLRETLRSIQPEFDKTAQQTFNEAATLLASQMSEKELQDVATFFDSPTGKKFLAVQPVFLQKFASLAGPWQQKLSSDIVTRAREEMKKKGFEF